MTSELNVVFPVSRTTTLSFLDRVSSDDSQPRMVKNKRKKMKLVEYEKKRKWMDINTKAEMVKEFERGGITQIELATKYGTNRSSVSRLLKPAKKAKILKDAEGHGHRKELKIVRESKFDLISKGTVALQRRLQMMGIPCSQFQLRAYGRHFAKALGVNDFSASNGWLDSMMLRYNLRISQTTGKSDTVDPDVVQKFRDEIPVAIENFEKRNILNLDETSFFYRVFPRGTLCQRGEKTKHIEMSSKLRVTICLVVSMTGERFKPLVIGKSKSPRPFAGRNMSRLPCMYANQPSSWMTSEIFADYLTKMDKRFKRQKRKVLLFCDQAPVHKLPDDTVFTNITVQYLPASATSVLQPLDLGIIRSFKSAYKKLLLNDVAARVCEAAFSTIEEKKDLVQKKLQEITILRAMEMAKKSFDGIDKEWIVRCWGKAGFATNPSPVAIGDEQADVCATGSAIDTPDVIPIATEIGNIPEALAEFVSLADVTQWSQQEELTATVQQTDDAARDAIVNEIESQLQRGEDLNICSSDIASSSIRVEPRAQVSTVEEDVESEGSDDVIRVIKTVKVTKFPPTPGPLRQTSLLNFINGNPNNTQTVSSCPSPIAIEDVQSAQPVRTSVAMDLGSDPTDSSA